MRQFEINEIDAVEGAGFLELLLCQGQGLQ